MKRAPVIPAKAGIQLSVSEMVEIYRWIPAYAGMTVRVTAKLATHKIPLRFVVELVSSANPTSNKVSDVGSANGSP